MRKNDADFIMLPTVDFCFKELMRNSKVRKGFVAALLQTDPDKIGDTIILPESLSKDGKEDKQGYLDIRIMLSDGTQMNILFFQRYKMLPNHSYAR